VRIGLSLIALLCGVSFSAPSSSAEKPAGGDAGPYELVPGWMKPIEPGYSVHTLGVFADTADRVIITATGSTPGTPTGGYDPAKPGAKLDHMAMVVNRKGEVVEEWRQWYPLWKNLHYVRVNPNDPEKHVWILDRNAQQIFEFSHDGKRLIRTLGESGVAGSDDKHFGRPSDIAWLPDGSFFVADGYVNRRVVKMDRNGKFLMSWGEQGTGPGQFGGIVHSIAVGQNGRVYVTDAGNKRLQIFDQDGKFIDQWPIAGPIKVMVAGDGAIWVLDYPTNRFFKYSPSGTLLTSWEGLPGKGPGEFNGEHDVSVDPEGNLYIAMTFNYRIEKYRPKRNADPSQLIAPARPLKK
jgi:DNA-binding beta-propeller fold protein YncE